MRISEKGINLIKEFEGCSLVAYRDPAGILTIGYGHTADVYPGQVITEEEAEKLLKADLVWCEQAVIGWNYHYNWTQGEFDGLCSFTFNCGEGEFLNLIKNGARSKDVIAEKMLLYVHDINGRELPGLVRRRQAEHELFLSEYSDQNNSEDEYSDLNTVQDVVRAIWQGRFGNDEERKDKLYKFFQKKVNEGRPDGC